LVRGLLCFAGLWCFGLAAGSERLRPAHIKAERAARFADAGEDAVIIVVEQVFDTGIEAQAAVGDRLPARVGVGDDIARAVFGRIQRFVILSRRLDPTTQGQPGLFETPATIDEEPGRGERAERIAGRHVLAVNACEGGVEREGALTEAQLDLIAFQLSRAEIAALCGAGRAGREEGRRETGRVEGKVDEEIDQIVGLGLIPGRAQVKTVGGNPVGQVKAEADLQRLGLFRQQVRIGDEVIADEGRGAKDDLRQGEVCAVQIELVD
jgi:hypothetical protein